MKRVDAEVVQTEFTFRSRVNISNISFEWGVLTVTLMSSEDKRAAVAKFDEVVRFRLLDEGDLLEYWPICAAKNGWLFQITANGWFDLETTRSGFLRDRKSGLTEYFISSQNSCVSVLSNDSPNISIFSI